jgi:hypothetical protein
MNIYQATNEILKGQKLRRLSWHEGIYIKYKYDYLTRSEFNLFDCDMILYDFNNVFDIDDLKADDWVIE